LVDFSGRHIVRHIVTATGHTPEVDGLAPAEFAVVPATIATRIRMFANANNTAANFGTAITNTRLITGPLTVDQDNALRAFITRRLTP
jgi:hypothetical protein